MPKSKAPSIPDTGTCRILLEEYLEMLRDAERQVKKVLSLNPAKEEYWDALADLDPLLTQIESSSNSLQEESLNLLDQLPED